MNKIALSMLLTCVGFVSVFAQEKLQRIPCTADLQSIRFKKVDTLPGRAVSDNYRTWENGQVLLVKFMPGGSQSLRERIIAGAKEWELYGNIKFQFVPDTTAATDLRIKLGKGMGHNSTVGTDANYRAQNTQTMNFDTLYFADVTYYLAKLKAKGIQPPYNYEMVSAEMATDPFHWNAAELKRVVTHEFGHALGLLHEQSFPNAVNWKKTDSVYSYYEQTQGWDRARVDFNVFEAANQFSTNGTAYDPKSIMHYSIASWQTNDGYVVPDNYFLSSGDKMIIGALYPKDQTVSTLEVPKVTISKGAKFRVVVDTVKNGLSVFPMFDLKTNSKLGHVYFVVKLVDQDNYYITTSNQFYNWGGVASSYVLMNLMPNSNISYNKTNRNLEIFFPFAQMPELGNKEVKIEFSVVLDDVANGQLNKIMYNTLTNPLSLTRQTGSAAKKN